MKKILCLVLVAAVIACGVLAVSNGNKVAALTTELDAANAKVAELEAAVETAAADISAAELQAQIDLYKPFYDAQVVISFDGGAVMLDERRVTFTA